MEDEQIEKELIKCSKCGCKKLLKFYSNNPNTEIRFKTCDNCRAKYRNKKCSHDNCENNAIKSGVCFKHGAIRKKCSHDNCENNAIKSGVCIKHGAIRKKCSADGCDNNAKINGVCFKHGAIRKKCSHDNCENIAIKSGVCVKHGATLRKCSHDNCENNAIKSGVCHKHGAKLKKCSADGCDNNAKINGICIKHGAKVKKCSHDECDNNAIKDGVCIKHGAIRKKCSHENCENNAQNGGVCIKHGAKVRKCSHDECDNNAIKSGVCIKHGAKIKKCTHDKYKQNCYLCGNPNHFCKICKMTDIRRNKGKLTEGYCLPCFSYTFPDIKLPRRYLLKEIEFRNRLKELYPHIDFIFGRKIMGDCSSGRLPDVRIELKTHTIILECDEFAHKYYDEMCENKRICEIFEDLGNRPIVILRLNPDSYTDTEGNKIQGCFETTKTGLKVNRKDFNIRVNVLIPFIDKYLINIPDQEMRIEKFFY
jgi:hypothetical protein